MKKNKPVFSDIGFNEQEALALTVKADLYGKLLDVVDVDDVVRHHVAEVHHRHQRLAAGQHPRILQSAEQVDGIGHGPRIVIGEWRRLHVPSLLSPSPHRTSAMGRGSG